MGTSALPAFALCVFGLLLSVSCEDVYPSSYPFDDEVGLENLFVKLPAVTPSFTFDETDPGGYGELTTKCDFNALHKRFGSQKWSPAYCEGARFRLAKVDAWKYDTAGMTQEQALEKFLDPKFEKSYLNCSHYSFYGGRSYSETVAKFLKYNYWEHIGTGWKGETPTTEKLCTSENCCDMKTLQPYSGIEDTKSYMKRLRLEGANYKCDSPPLPYICDNIVYSARYCLSRYISPTKRNHVPICPDMKMRYELSCKAQINTWDQEKAGNDESRSKRAEPQKFMQAASVKEFLVSLSYIYHPDKVCRPYSYFYPTFSKKKSSTLASSDAAKSSTAANKSSTAAAKSSTAASTSTSSAKVIGIMSLFLAAIVVVL